MLDDDANSFSENRGGAGPRRGSPKWGRWGVLAAVAGGAVLLFTVPGQRVGRAVSRRLFPPVGTADAQVIIRERVVEKRVEVPVVAAPPALPTGPSLSPRGGDLGTLFSGIGLKTSLIPSAGDTATAERASEAAYVVEMVLKLRVPRPATTFEQLLPLNPKLGLLLPELRHLMERGKVSGFYHYLYDLKEKAVAANLKRLDRLPSRHNFYDLDAMMELEHAESGQKMLLMQADMDVVSDGSDGDRMPVIDEYILKSSYFQPTTSYGWAKLTDQLNPVIPKLEEELVGVQGKLKAPKLSKEEKASLTARAEEIPRVVADLKRRSYLVGQEDPFIVIPSSLRSYQGRNAWAPSIGDYAVVVCGDQLLPAVVGDYGPTTKVGEASLRIARQVDPEAGPYRRPVSDLKVTYLIFPASADAARQPPDYAAWKLRCQDLLGKMGGLGAGVALHEWEDRLKPKPAAVGEGLPEAVPEVPSVPAVPAVPEASAPAGENP